ncbi:MAG: hypothetical protein LUB63_03040, partial [Oscillospiraceae bacterium]|nr:hypothetical protein [Oscillospiraceae bacterium]
LLDCYECFGWSLNPQFSAGLDQAMAKGKPVTLHLKRPRSIVNRVELTRLQRNFEAVLDEIDRLERSKTSKPSVLALTLGLIGTAFMACSTFAVTASPPRVLLCILLSIPGLAGWIFPRFVYKKTLAGEIRRIQPLIEGKYDEIDELCKKGTSLLH